MLKSSIIISWSFFEAWAGDMWEVAVNVHPDGLAELKGSSKRIKGAHGARKRESQNITSSSELAVAGEGSKTVSLATIHRLTRGTYDLSGRMGSLLRERYPFERIEGIRRAYSEAFYAQSNHIDAALGAKCIDALNVVRNVIVHRAGIADAEYVKKSKFISEIPQVEKNEEVKINGMLVSNIINPVVQCSADLLLAVDGWLITHRRPA